MTYNIIILYDVISLIIFIKLCQKKLNIFFRVESCNKIQWGLKLLFVHDTYIMYKINQRILKYIERNEKDYERIVFTREYKYEYL